jgi:multiple sugar transport system substrate-binding protein
VRPVFTPNDLSTNQKFFTSVAADTPPDVTFVDGPQVAEWAERGALAPLDRRLEAVGITADDYFPPCWRQNYYDGHVWALTFCADPNFAFVWNKTVFRAAGLDADRPPRTIAELDRCADRIATREDGQLTRIGIIPWGVYGSANSIFTWGWAFGGEFYDDRRHRITANDPRIVAALQWMCNYAKRYDITKINALQTGFGTAEQNPFYIGKLAMTCLHIGGLEEIRRFAPDLDFGAGYLPAPPEGEAHSSWVGGWCVAIPSNSPHPEQAWTFVRWACATPEGTALMGRLIGLFPGYRKSPYLREVEGREYDEMYLRILEESRHQRPVMPVQAYYMGALQRAVDAALYGRKTPKQALDQATAETQAELDLILAGRGRKRR